MSSENFTAEWSHSVWTRPSTGSAFRLSSFAFALLIIAGCFGGAASDEPTAANAPEANVSVAEVVDTPTANQAEDFPQAINFTMSTLDGEALSLESQRGRYVLVNFWATWCVPCRKEMPYLQQLSETYDGELTVLGVNLREDAERIAPFIDEMGLTFPILLDPPDELLMEHNVRGLPVSYVVDPSGAVVYEKIGEILPEEFDSWLAQTDGLAQGR